MFLTSGVCREFAVCQKVSTGSYTEHFLWTGSGFFFHPNKQVDSLYHVNLIKFTTKDPKRIGFARKKNLGKIPQIFLPG